jgi:hypothetical protein
VGLGSFCGCGDVEGRLKRRGEFDSSSSGEITLVKHAGITSSVKASSKGEHNPLEWLVRTNCIVLTGAKCVLTIVYLMFD